MRCHDHSQRLYRPAFRNPVQLNDFAPRRALWCSEVITIAFPELVREMVRSSAVRTNAEGSRPVVRWLTGE
jgi:hypothetical protein